MQKDDFTFVHPLRVRWAEVDRQDVVRAERLGVELRAEDGAGRAAEVIDGLRHRGR